MVVDADVLLLVTEVRACKYRSASDQIIGLPVS